MHAHEETYETCVALEYVWANFVLSPKITFWMGVELIKGSLKISPSLPIAGG